MVVVVKRPTLANHVLAILSWPILANPILANPFLAVVVLARPILANPFLANPFLDLVCVVVGPWRVGPRRVEAQTLKKWGPEGWGSEGWEAQHFALFFSVCRRKFRSFFSLWDLFVELCYGRGSRPWPAQSARLGFSGVILCEPRGLFAPSGQEVNLCRPNSKCLVAIYLDGFTE